MKMEAVCSEVKKERCTVTPLSGRKKNGNVREEELGCVFRSEGRAHTQT